MKWLRSLCLSLGAAVLFVCSTGFTDNTPSGAAREFMATLCSGKLTRGYLLRNGSEEFCEDLRKVSASEFTSTLENANRIFKLFRIAGGKFSLSVIDVTKIFSSAIVEVKVTCRDSDGEVSVEEVTVCLTLEDGIWKLDEDFEEIYDELKDLERLGLKAIMKALEE